MNTHRLLIMIGASFLLSGCLDNTADYRDLDQYMAEMRARPKGHIEPLPQFRPYEAFTYSASAKRSPFEPPVTTTVNQEQLDSNIKPDLERTKEYLEQFDLDSFSLVGSISNDDGLWGLIRGVDGIHRVKSGDYLGRNHGRIVFIDETELRLLEIVPAGPDFWIERPRSIRLSDQ